MAAAAGASLDFVDAAPSSLRRLEPTQSALPSLLPNQLASQRQVAAIAAWRRTIAVCPSPSARRALSPLPLALAQALAPLDSTKSFWLDRLASNECHRHARLRPPSPVVQVQQRCGAALALANRRDRDRSSSALVQHRYTRWNRFDLRQRAGHLHRATCAKSECVRQLTAHRADRCQSDW